MKESIDSNTLTLTSISLRMPTIAVVIVKTGKALGKHLEGPFSHKKIGFQLCLTRQLLLFIETTQDHPLKLSFVKEHLWLCCTN